MLAFLCCYPSGRREPDEALGQREQQVTVVVARRCAMELGRAERWVLFRSG